LGYLFADYVRVSVMPKLLSSRGKISPALYPSLSLTENGFIRWSLLLSICTATALASPCGDAWSEMQTTENDALETQAIGERKSGESRIDSDILLEPVELELAETLPSEEDTALPTVTVKAQNARNPHENKSYQGNSVEVGKTGQLTKDIPQSLTVISKQLMQDRGAVSLQDALRNVAGLTSSAGEGGRIGDNVNIRGFSAVGDMYLDGVRDAAQYNRDIFNLEQVEVLRGSASMLYGRGSTGGVINQVSKKPQREDSYSANLSGGAYGFLRASADINKVLSEKVAFRLNTMITSSDSFRNDVEQKRWGIAPSLSWGTGTKNEAVLSYFFLKENNIPDYGIPYFGGRPLKVPLQQFYGLSNVDYEHNKASIATLTYTHRFNPHSTWRTILRQGYYDRDLRATAPRMIGTPLFMTNDTPILREMKARGSTENSLTAQTEYIGKFHTGPVKHEMLAGYSFLWERAKRWNNANPFGYPNATVGEPDSTPSLPSNFYSSFERDQFNRYSGITNSVYIQDSMEPIRHLKIVGGVRLDALRSSQRQPSPLDRLQRTDTMWSYRGGLIYQPNELASYYVSYGTSFNPSSELYAMDARTVNSPPEKNRNIETGAKWELLNGNLSLRTALFRTEKTNERNVNPLLLDSVVLGGKRHTQGVELEAIGRITKNWQIFSGLVLMRSNIDAAKFNQAANLGNRPANTPNFMYNLWSTYTFPLFHGVCKIGGGIDGMGMRAANTTNTNEVPGYHRVDAMIEYSIRNYALRLNLFNLLNNKYYASIGGGHAVPASLRSGMLTLSIGI
jgi:catecholate siderophore receptor